jgi:hypothetical protein
MEEIAHVREEAQRIRSDPAPTSRNIQSLAESVEVLAYYVTLMLEARDGPR